jgi:hypothetical protein
MRRQPIQAARLLVRLTVHDEQPTCQAAGNEGREMGRPTGLEPAEVAANVGVFSWSATATADSAILVTLPPGACSAEISGASGDAGLALVEVYDVQ